MNTSSPPRFAPITLDSTGRGRVSLDGGALRLNDLDTIYARPIALDIAAGVWQRVERSRQVVARLAASSTPAYGINTGVGHLCNRRIPPEQVEQLQANLIRSHAVGVGAPVPDEIVRWMMLFKVHALTHGVSGVSRETIATLVGALNADLLPVVPRQGSLGASGDLAPLAHMVLPLMGVGRLRRDEALVAADAALRDAGVAPLRLAAKEGLALINGTQFMSAYGAVLAIRAARLMRHADILASMSLEGLRGSVKPFDERLHLLRPHPGAIETAENVRRLMAESEIVPSHADCERVQDPYSLRCVPQVHGASRDAIRHATAIIETEINSVTDNPLIFEPDDVISGGSFHGQPLALPLDYLAIALSELASISERRIYLLLSGHDGLPALLMRNTGINSGFMLPQYTAAALVSENKIFSSPASVDSIPTSLGQEDHVSMGATAAVKCLQVLENTETVLAIELMCAAQALDYRAPMQPGLGPRIAHAVVREVLPHAEEDRIFGEDIHASLDLLRSGTIARRVQERLGKLQ
jgi:histidine ammonia-lyase